MKLIRNFVVVGVLFASGAFAANLLTNGSFESGTFNNNSLGTNEGQLLTVGSTSLSGWSVIANGGTTSPTLVWVQTGDYSLTSENGSLFLDLTGFYDTTPFGGISQVVNLAAGSYALTFWLGVNQSITNDSGPVTVTASAGSTSGTFTSASSGTGNIWTQQTLTFNVASAGNVTISLLGNTVPQGHQYIGLDNVDLEQTGVPEPAMSLPLALAGALFVLSRRKRARQ